MKSQDLGRREYLAFLAATGAVMVHVTDDNFLQPAAGVSPADHLASGLVPLAALAIAAWAFSRVVPGVRALIALAVALTGLVVGLVEAGYHTATVGPYGDDYTGFLAGAAGLFLAGLAVRTLWRSRRSGNSRTRRYARRLGIGVLAVLVLSEVGLRSSSATSRPT
jgi:hypothetical protein